MSFNFTSSAHPRLRHNPHWNDSRNDNDRLYYNITIRNERTDNKDILARFEEERVQPIIDNPNDYYLTISRFTVPGSEIPLFIFPIQDFPNLNPDLSPLSITLDNNGDIQQQFIIYDSLENDKNPPSPPTANNPLWQRTDYYFVYNYDHMINMINAALETAFNNLAAPPAGAVPPRVEFDPATQLISWVVQRAFYENNVAAADRIDIYVNTPLINYLDGAIYKFFGTDTPNGQDLQLVVKDNIHNFYQPECDPFPVASSIITSIPLGGPGSILITTGTAHGLSIGDIVEIVGSNSNPIIDGTYTVLTAPSPTTFRINIGVALIGAGGAGFVSPTCNFLKITQNYNNIARWTSFKDLVFLTNTIPVVLEYIKSTGEGLVNFQPILTDFEPLLSSAGDARSTLQFFPQGPYRLINLSSTIPLRKIDVSVFWKDELNNLYPVKIAKGQVLTIKLLFIKK